jgi:hypothetical protein
MKMQRFNAAGEAQWQEQGKLVSSHPQDTWLTDYDLTVTSNNEACLVFNDCRAGQDWDIYAYKLSSDGSFLWGEDGIIVSSNSNFEVDPKVAVTSTGAVVVCWVEERNDSSVVNLRKFTSDGQDFWQNPTIKSVGAEYGLSIARVVAAENDAIIMQALVQTGPSFMSPRNIYAYKLSLAGEHLWGQDGVVVSDAGGIGLQVKAGLQPDGAGGAFAYWYDARNGNEHHVYAQHVLADGTMDWADDGVQVSLTYGEMQMVPAFVYLPSQSRIIIFYEATDYNQAMIGVHGQMLDSEGSRMWGDAGSVLVPMSAQSRMLICGVRQDGGAIAAYLETVGNNESLKLVKAIRVDMLGQPVWPNSPIEMTTTQCDRLFLNAAVNDLGQMIAVWTDNRFGPAGDIFLQNINPDGSFGPYPTAIDDETESPSGYWLLGSYPNPFNGTAVITVEGADRADIGIFDVAGRRVDVLRAEGGRAFWNAAGQSSGIYFARVINGGKSSAATRLIYMK